MARDTARQLPLAAQAPVSGPAPASRRTRAGRITFLALGICGAGAPLLPTTSLKVAATLSAALVLLVGWCARLRAGEPIGRTPLDAPAVTLLLASVLATLFSVSPSAGVLPSRAGGECLLVYAAYIVMALAASRLSRQDASALVAVIMWSGGLVAAIAVAQFYGLDITWWIGRMGTLPMVRGAGTLGNRMFLGGYVSLLLPICVAVATDPAQRRRGAYAAVAAVLYMALVASQTRAAWVGSALASVLLVRLLPASRGTPKRLALLGAVLASITFLMVFTQPHVALAQRAMSTFNLQDPSLRERLLVWQQTFSLILRRPILGRGFVTPLDQLPGIHVPEDLRRIGDRPAVAHTTHNELLHIAYITGLAGLGSYLWIWTVLVIRLWGALDAAAAGPRLPAALLAALAGYFIWLQLAWSHIGTANAFWALAGSAIALTRASSAPHATPRGDRDGCGEGRQ